MYILFFQSSTFLLLMWWKYFNCVCVNDSVCMRGEGSNNEDCPAASIR